MATVRRFIKDKTGVAKWVYKEWEYNTEAKAIAKIEAIKMAWEKFARCTVKAYPDGKGFMLYKDGEKIAYTEVINY